MESVNVSHLLEHHVTPYLECLPAYLEKRETEAQIEKRNENLNKIIRYLLHDIGNIEFSISSNNEYFEKRKWLWIANYCTKDYRTLTELYSRDKFLQTNSFSKLYEQSEAKKSIWISLISDSEIKIQELNSYFKISIPETFLCKRHEYTQQRNYELSEDTWHAYEAEKTEENSEIQNDKENWFYGIEPQNQEKLIAAFKNFFGDLPAKEEYKNFSYPRLLRTFSIIFYYNQVTDFCYLHPLENLSEFPPINILLLWDRNEIKPNPDIQTALNQLIKNISLVSIILKRREVQSEHIRKSIQSGIAAIMSRNGSHNIGSHVLSVLSRDSIDALDDRFLFKYIQHRMDYIAQITTEMPSWSSSFNFITQTLKDFYLQRQLLNNIAKSEGLTAYECCTLVKEPDKNGFFAREPSQLSPRDKLIIKIRDANDEQNTYLVDPQSPAPEFQIEEAKDINIAIPGGIIGNHALYTILENFIRNSTKHNWSRLKQMHGKTGDREAYPENLIVTIEFDAEKMGNLVKIRLFDNCSDVFSSGTFTDFEKEANLLLPESLELDNGLKETDRQLPLHQEINCFLSRSFVDEITGELKKENWGLAEMKISAGYLNNRTFSNIGRAGEHIVGDQEEWILRAVAVKDEHHKTHDTVYRLGYEFCIPKPREVLIVGDFIEIDDEIETAANSKNIYFEKGETSFKQYDFVVYKGKCKNPHEFPYRLFIIGDEVGEEKTSFVSAKPFYLDRQIADELSSLLRKQDFETFKLTLMRLWIGEKYCDHFIDKDGKSKKCIMAISPYGNTIRSSEFKENLIFLKYFNQYKKYLSKEKLKSNFMREQHRITPDQDPLEYFADYIKNDRDYIGEYNKLFSSSIDGHGEKCKCEKIDLGCEKIDLGWEVFCSLMYKFEGNVETLPKFYALNNLLKGEDKPKGYEVHLAKGQVQIFPQKVNDVPANVLYKRHLKPSIERDTLYEEALSGAQSYLSSIEYIYEQPSTESNSYEIELFLLKMIESALCKILIIDERAYDYYLNQSKKHIFDAARIEIIGHYNPSDNIKGYLNYYDYIVIHQGILDKNPGRQSEVIQTLEKHTSQLVVTSGRGKPEGKAHSKVKFLPYSNLESFIIKTYHEKLVFLQTLNRLTIEGDRG